MDHELTESAQFTVNAPDLQANLTAEIERGSVPREYVNRYQADHDVRCAFCAGHTLHRRGFTVKMADGRIALCGIDCAKEFFGEEIAARFERDLERQISHQALRAVLSRTVLGAPAALRILDQSWIELENDLFAAVRAIQEWTERDQLKRDVSDGTLYLKRVRSTSITTTARDGREIRKKQEIEEVVGRAVGASCLLSNGKMLALARGGLVALQEWSSRPQMITGKKADDLSIKRRKTVEALKEGTDFVRAAHRFFTEPSIQVFNAWHRSKYSARDRIQLKLDANGGLTVLSPDSEGLPTVIQLPKSVPDAAILLGLLTSSKAA